MGERLPGLFVTGTDTGVGKTLVAAAIARALAGGGHRVGVLKPVATGAARTENGWRCDDTEALIAAAGGGIPRERVTPILYEEPLAPCIAARRAGEPLHAERVERAVKDALAWWAGPGGAELVVIEGVGGLLCPLAEGTTVADLAVALDYPLIVVARRGLGTLNHTLMTVEAARGRSLRVAGVVLNTPEPESGTPAESTAAGELARRLPGVPILAEIRHAGNSALPDPMVCVDWYGRALPPRTRGPY